MIRKALYLVGAIGALSCSAVLGLDEPTHRQDAAAGTGGDPGGSGMQAGGSSLQGGAGMAQMAGSNGGGGAVGSGGSSGGGVSGSGGSSTDGGGTGGSPSDGGGKDVVVVGGCSAGLCDDFETSTAMGRPDPAKWKIDPTIPVDKLGIDPTFFHSGSHSVAINAVSASGMSMVDLLFRNDTVAVTLGPIVYIRFWVMMRQGSSGRGAFFVATDVNGRRFMVGIENNVLTHRLMLNNVVTATMPSDPAVVTSPMLLLNTWQCIEIKIDRSGEVQTWFNGAGVTALHADLMPTSGVDDTWNLVGWKPNLDNLAFGWQPYFMSQNFLNIDDVAVTNQRIGCN